MSFFLSLCLFYLLSVGVFLVVSLLDHPVLCSCEFSDMHPANGFDQLEQTRRDFQDS